MLVKSQVKYIQSLGQKKFRDQEGVFVAEGPKLLDELLKASNIRLLHIYATREWLEDKDERSWANSAPAPLISLLKKGELERISGLITPNQVLAVCCRPVFGAPSFENSVSLLLDGIQDPGNMGTMIRIADWFGISQIACSPDSADCYNAKTVQSTMGSISRVQVVYCDLEELIGKYPALPVYGAALKGKPLYEMEPILNGLIVMGNESKGIRKELLEKIPHPVTIPRRGKAESLNAAVAAGIVLSHLMK
jgi:RNA methyltransferase, TrmH family